MVLDRFGDLKADSNHTVVEMEGLLSVPSAGGIGLDDFLNEVEAFKNDLKTVRNNIGEIERLHYATLLSVEDRATRDSLDQLSEETKRLIGQLRAQIKGFMETTDRMKKTRNAQIRRNHERTLANELMKIASEYQQMEQKVKEQHREKLERQHKILFKEGTSDEEITRVLFDQQSAIGQYGEQQRLLQDVQSRHVQLQHIEEAITQLFDLMQEMNFLLDQHQEIINIIDDHVEQGARAIEKGNEELGVAITTAKSTRKKKWTIAAIVTLALAGVGGFVAYQVTPHNQGNTTTR